MKQKVLKILSIICLCCGIFLFVPGLMEPEELRVPLYAGAIGIGTGVGGCFPAAEYSCQIGYQ